MRSGVLLLPQHDERLCARVLLQAEYLGMEALLAEVKAQAYANLHPDTHQEEERPLAQAFDEDVGSIAAAIRSKVLPARYFAAAPTPPAPPPPPPERVIKQLWPAAPGYRALFTNGAFQWGDALADEDDEDMVEDDVESESLHILSWALVEHPDGTQHLDAVVQRVLEPTQEVSMRSNEGYTHMLLASMYTHRFEEEGNVRWSHWAVVPPPAPRAPGQMLPIPPGSVRGLWAKPAITQADVGKDLTVRGSTIEVGEETRHVEWDTAPSGVISGKICRVFPWDDVQGSGVLVPTGDGRIEIPRLAGTGMEIDLAFASVVSEGSVDQETRFLMPVHSRQGLFNGPPRTELCDATTVTFGAHRFCHFIGAKRS